MSTAYELFMAALQNVLETTKTTQKELAERSGMAAQTISNIVRGGKNAGAKTQETIAEACGYSYIDFLTLGKSIMEGIAPARPAVQQNNHGDTRMLGGDFSSPPAAAIAAVTSLADQFLTQERTLMFWRSLFEAIAEPMCVIKDGIVIKQNQKSRAWGIMEGQALCGNCMNGLCDMTCPGDICAVKRAQRTGTAAKQIKETPWGKVLLSCSPMRWNNEEYYIVTGVVISETAEQSTEKGISL